MNTQDVPTLTVSELTAHLKTNIERTYSHIKVRGEIGRVSSAPSGHIYADIKDQKALMSIVVWRGSTLKMKIQEGLEMIVTGKMTIFPNQSKYQLVVTQAEASGLGAWMVLLEERKKKCIEQGLFDPTHKKPLPFLPRVVGIVTSSTGAVILDMLHRFHERFPLLHIIIWPVRVQGSDAAHEIETAIDGFNDPDNHTLFQKPDVLIVARGGGSIEDLWCFNEENVVHAVYRSRIPLVSAIGHETDVTLIDYVSDKRAPTPTAAAEFTVPVLSQLKESLAHLFKRIVAWIHRRIDQARYQLSLLTVPSLSDLLAMAWQKIDYFQMALKRIVCHLLQKKTLQLDYIQQVLTAYHYQNVLKRGFSVVRHKGSILSDWQSVQKGDKLDIELDKGRASTLFLEAL